MKKFIYVLSDYEDGKYADLTYISASFLRKVHPDANIIIYCDLITQSHLIRKDHPLIHVADHIAGVECPEKSNNYKSRFIKTNLRRLVSGDFVYLDADTIIRGPLDDMFLISEPIGLISNLNGTLPDNMPSKEVDAFVTNGWSIPLNGVYFNGGIISWRDLPASFQFCEYWAAAWKESADNGIELDQPALNYAIACSGIGVKQLDQRYNAQVRSNVKASMDALIWHFFETDKQIGIPDYFSIIRKRYERDRKIDDELINQVICARTQYRLKDRNNEAIAEQILQSGMRLDLPTYEKLSGETLMPGQFATVCTIISSGQLTFAWTLFDSIRKFDQDVSLNLLIIDDEPVNPINKIKHDSCHIHRLSDVCSTSISKKIRQKFEQKNKDEFTWALKPVFINYLLRSRRYEQVFYVDVDIHFFNPFEFLYDLLRRHRILLTPNWRTRWPAPDNAEYSHMIRHGMYDAGFIAVASTATDVMDWWAECCLHAPKGKILEGVRGDEATLNLMPVYFKDVHILQHKGCNVGEWNQNECIRVLQPDGEILINGTEPIIFIHFNSTMDHNTDIMLLGHLKKYLLTLKNNDPSHTIYERIKIIRNNYGNQHKLPNWYKLLKKKILQILSACFHHKNINNTAILSHPGTPKQQLGLRLRKNRGVIVSDLPFKEWQPDTEAKMLQNMQELYFSQGIDAINGFTEDLMEHKKSNLPSMHWENIRSLLSWKMILIMLPDNSLCWPLLAEAIGKKWKTIALFANPFHFALRMHTFENQAWKAKALAEVDDFLNKRPILHNLVHEHESAISRWILKWWIDLTRLKKRADEGAHIHIIHEDDLYHAQDETLTGICEKLGLPYDPTISIQQHHNYIYSVEPSQKNKAGQWRRYLSDKEYQTGAELLEQLEITETGSSVRHHD